MPETSKRAVLQSVSFGQQIAEQEVDELRSYFVETEQWRRIFSGDVDVVYGAKGAGKSAIYSLLQGRAEALRDRGVIVVAAENPRGTPVFKDLVADPPTTENEFRGLWKLYFLVLIARQLQLAGVNGRMKDLLEPLAGAGLLAEGDQTLKGILRAALEYVRALLQSAATFEAGVKLDPSTGLPTGLTGKITLREPTPSERKLGLVSVDRLLELANEILESANLRVWILLDRLDVAFAESDDLEQRGLRALFRVYLDFQAFTRMAVKIFLRSDIWQRITQDGFREASHITKAITISWEAQSLLNLVVRRALRNEALRDYYGVGEHAVLQDATEQAALFYKVFPQQVDAGERRPETLDWMISRIRDGHRETAPRELIHLLRAAQSEQLTVSSLSLARMSRPP